MKKIKLSAFRKDVERSIIHSISRMLAIFVIVALGAGFYSGLGAVQPDMQDTADAYYDAGHMHDIRLISTLGVSDDDVRAIRALDGVSNIMAGYSIDAISSIGGEERVVRVHSLPTDCSDDNDDYLNRPVLLEGRMPETADECLLAKGKYHTTEICLGDQIVLDNDSGQLDDTLSRTSFTVVGFVESSYYIASTLGTSSIGSGTVGNYLYVQDSNFLPDYYSDVYLTVTDALALDCFSEQYDNLVETVTDEMEAMSDSRELLRYNEVITQAKDSLADAQAEYDDAKETADTELNDALVELEAGEESLASAQNKLDTLAHKLASGRSELDARQADYNTKLQAYNDAYDQWLAASTQLATQQAQWDAAKLQLDADFAAYNAQIVSGVPAESLADVLAVLQATQTALTQQKAQLDATQQYLDSSATQLSQTKAQLDVYAAGLAEAASQLSESESELSSARWKLREGRSELDDRWEQYYDAKEQAETKLDDALDQIKKAESDINEIELAKWYILTRDANTGYVSFEADAGRMGSLSKVFPVMFFLVAALVALTTMTRAVDDERGIIGTYKALGYSSRLIMLRYLIYALVPSLLGSICGILIGFETLPRVVWAAYDMLYDAPSIVLPFRWDLALLSTLIMTIAPLTATFFVCRGSLNEQTAALLQPRSPKAGKRIFLEHISFIWHRLKFSQKVTCRNIFRYKKRLIMTLAGIAGCTALLVTGFGLRDSISEIIFNQFNVLYQYNTTIMLAEDELDKDAIELLNDESLFSSWTTYGQKGADLMANGRTVSGYITVPSDIEVFPDFLLMRDRITGKQVYFGKDSVVLTEKAASVLGVGIGDSIAVETENDKFTSFVITGITENYVYHYIYIAPQLYAQKCGAALAPNQAVAVCELPENDRAELSQTLFESDSVGTIAYSDSLIDGFSDMISSLNYVIYVLIICAGALAFVVLYNLTSINITERTRELATIKVLGFTDREVSAYIYRETALLAAMGCVLGLAFGVILHHFVITTVEVDAVMFGRNIEALSFLLSAVITMLFSLIVDLVMRPRLRRIDMVESLKSVD